MAQIVIHVLTSNKNSLRETIIKDEKLANFKLKVAQQKKQNRSNGWSKLHSASGEDGAINIQWEATSRMLIGRVVTRGGSPAAIIGDFVYYMMERYRRKIETINIIPR